MATVARSDGQLLAASVTASLAGAAFIVVVERHLGTEGFEPVAQIWNMWAISAAFLTISTQLGTIGSSGDLGQVVNRRLVGALSVLSVGLGVFSIVFATQLFGEADLWPLIAAAVPLGAAAMGITRGYWASHRNFRATAGVIVSENLVRLTCAVLLVGLSASAPLFAVAILIGFAPAAFTPWRNVVRRQADRTPTTTTPNQTAGASGIAALLAFVTFSSAPAVIAVVGGTDFDASAAFLALALARVPHGLSQGIIPRLSVAANERVIAGRASELRSWRLRLGLGSLALTPLVGAAGALLLHPLAGFVFGADAQLDSLAYGFSAIAAILNVALIGQVVVLAAERRFGPLVRSWLVAVPIALVGAVTIDLRSPTAVFALASVVEAAVVVAYLVQRSQAEPVA